MKLHQLAGVYSNNYRTITAVVLKNKLFTTLTGRSTVTSINIVDKGDQILGFNQPVRARSLLPLTYLFDMWDTWTPSDSVDTHLKSWSFSFKITLCGSLLPLRTLVEIGN